MTLQTALKKPVEDRRRRPVGLGGQLRFYAPLDRLERPHRPPVQEGGPAAARRGQPRHRRARRSSAAPSASSRFLAFFTGTEVGPAGLLGAQPARLLGLHRVRLRLLQHPRDRAAGRRPRAGRHGRLRLHRAARRHADQRGGRRARGDGHPEPAVPRHHPDDRRLRRRDPALRASACCRRTSPTRLIATGYYGQSKGTYDHYFHLFLPPGRRALVVRQGAGLRRGHHPDPLLLRLHAPAAARPASAWRSARRSAPRSSPSTSSTSSSASPSGAPPRPSGSRGSAMLMKARSRSGIGQRVLLRTYGVVFLRRARAAGRAHASLIYNKTFVDVVHVTLQTDRVGNQLAPPADVKLRGMIVGEVRAVSVRRRARPPSTSRCSRRPPA